MRRPLTVAIASGKGGTGKTLVATSLAAVWADEGERVALVDCDAEAPNDHLFFDSPVTETATVDVALAAVDTESCVACGVCRDLCAYGAIRILGSTAVVFDELCHGCGLCERECPVGAIRELPRRVGRIDVRRPPERGGRLTLVSGVLDVGQVKTPDVIRAARSYAASDDPAIVLLDAPPGVACAAVASVRGADLVVLVTEPTAFGLHDLDLSVQLARALDIPAAIIVNRSDADGVDIDGWSDARGIPVLTHIPFERGIAETYATGDLVVDDMADLRERFGYVAHSIENAAVRSPGSTERRRLER